MHTRTNIMKASCLSFGIPKKQNRQKERWRCPKPRRSFRPIRSSFSGLSLSLPLCLSRMWKFLWSWLGYSICSKTWCPYCSQVKQLFSKLGVTIKAVELDTECECLFVPFLFWWFCAFFFFSIVNLLFEFLRIGGKVKLTSCSEPRWLILVKLFSNNYVWSACFRLCAPAWFWIRSVILFCESILSPCCVLIR